MPQHVIVAINAKGVHLLSPDTKVRNRCPLSCTSVHITVLQEVLQSFAYSDIMNWSSGHDYFHFSTGDMTRSGTGFRFLCETTLVYSTTTFMYIANL